MPSSRLISVPIVLLAIAIIAAGCSSGGAAAPSAASSPAGSLPPESMAPASPGESIAPGSMAPATPGEAAGSPTAPAPNPAAEALAGRPWATAALTDVTTGEPFTIADYAGKTIFVEQMAIWCSNCRAQQGRFREALAQLDPEKVAYVVLTVDPGETGEDLARYKKERGFTGTYAVAGAEVSKALADEFGANALNPPSVPLIVVTPAGEVSFGTGGESPEAIVKLAGG